MISKKTNCIVLSFSIIVLILMFITPAVADQVNISFNVPETVDGNFDVTIDMENINDLDSGQFDIYFDPAAVRVIGISNGTVNEKTIPADSQELSTNTIRVLFNLPGIDGISGSGFLATIHFETIVPGDCVMEMSDVLLVDTMARKILTNQNDIENTTGSATEPISADKTETPGFQVQFMIFLFAVAYLVLRAKGGNA
ncbi:MAG: cohesin domain-containing protein [Euryarchaeota archaeon]|nr:cohesin domain-containing protein [Euryarchaeota archaeon]